MSSSENSVLGAASAAHRDRFVRKRKGSFALIETEVRRAVGSEFSLP